MADEKFFEELAGERQVDEKKYEIELAKTTGSTTRKPSVEVRAPAKKEYEEDEPGGQLTIDVYQTPTEIIIESAIAGVRPEDIDINVTTDSITIKGERHREKEVKDEDYLYQECYWGRFSRSVILPQEVDPEAASVNFKNGILNVRLPKLNRKRQKRLKIKVE